MAYVFEHGETVPAAILRVFSEQIERARIQLSDGKAPLEKRIHDARKRFKETRALIRLIRDPLGDQYQVENVWFRNAGRDLAAVRDADAVVEALTKLAKAKPLSSHTQRRARRVLMTRRNAMPVNELRGRVSNVLGQLDIAAQRIGYWPPLDNSWEMISGGLARTYRGGRMAMETALQTRLPDHLHEWRKRVKEHWYHVQLLRHIWPEMMKSYAGEVEELSHALGDHHDLAVLRQIVARTPNDFGRPASVLALLDAIAQRQIELEEEAGRIGRHIYSERPRAWLARMRNYWHAWKTA